MKQQALFFSNSTISNAGHPTEKSQRSSTWRPTSGGLSAAILHVEEIFTDVRQAHVISFAFAAHHHHTKHQNQRQHDVAMAMKTHP